MPSLFPRASVLRAGLLAGGFAVVLAGPASAEIRVVHAVVIAPPPGAPTAAAYVTLKSADGRPDTLKSASSPDAKAVELHAMSMAGAVMRMRPITSGVEIPAQGMAVLDAKSGQHLMIVGPRRPLRPGGLFPIVLRFARSGPVRAAFRIETRPPAP